MLRATRSTALLLLGLVSCGGSNGLPEPFEARLVQRIIGGTEVATCAWPSVVYLERASEGHCSGTLVHPELVVFAAHCMSDGTPAPSYALFGERAETPARRVATTSCKSDPKFSPNPAVGRGHDVAYCKLSEAVVDVPIVPILEQCERDLAPGSGLTAVGFGESISGGLGDGVKREVELSLAQVVGNDAYIAEDGTGTCHGDSGGPIFSRAARGDWRIFAVTSWAPGACGDGEYASLVQGSLEWLEQSSGLELAPCRDCGRSAVDPEHGGGIWT